MEKSDNPKFIKKFDTKIKIIKLYKENEDNTKKLANNYDQILLAQAKTKKRKIEEEKINMKKSKERILQLQKNSFDEDADEYLRVELSKI